MVPYHVQYLTKEAAAIFDQRIGYRDDSLFPHTLRLTTDKHDPSAVVFTEVAGCGKLEICDFILLHYTSMLSHSDYRLLMDIIRQTRQTGYPTLSPDEGAQLCGITRRLAGENNYCVWLCSAPEHIYNYYLKDYIPRADRYQPGFAESCPEYEIKASMNSEEYISKYVHEYILSDNAVPLCDLGIQGVLVAMKLPEQMV